MAKSRKVRSDILVGNLEKKLGLEPGAIRNPDGSDARSNKKLDTLRKEFKKAKGKKIKTNPSISSKSIAKASKAIQALAVNNDRAKAIPTVAKKPTNTAIKKIVIKSKTDIGKNAPNPTKKTTPKVKARSVKKK